MIVVCSLKMFRSGFTSPSHQYLIVLFTALLFKYDLHGLSESFVIDYFFTSILLYKASTWHWLTVAAGFSWEL